MQEDLEKECARLKEKIELDAGPHNLSARELTFFQTMCSHDKSDLASLKDVVFSERAGIDNTGVAETGTIFDDPDAGRPDDPDDANPAPPASPDTTR